MTGAEIIGLHHAQITIPSGEEAAGRRFYCGVLGLAEIDKPTELAGRGGFWLQVGDQQVHVGTEDGIERSRSKAHLAYAVSEIAAWRVRLEQAGVELTAQIAVPGRDRFECRDPFGNRIEFTTTERWRLQLRLYAARNVLFLLIE